LQVPEIPPTRDTKGASKVQSSVFTTYRPDAAGFGAAARGLVNVRLEAMPQTWNKSHAIARPLVSGGFSTG
jgi:hypothetical protein